MAEHEAAIRGVSLEKLRIVNGARVCLPQPPLSRGEETAQHF